MPGSNERPRASTASAAVLVLAALVSPAGGQALELHGFVQGNYSIRVADTDDDDPPGDFLLGDHRLQLELAHDSDLGTVSFLTTVDLFHDAVDSRADIDVRETYITLAGDAADVRVGRQVITWGVGDLVFINDVFTKDWTALIAGQPLQYPKVGSDGANLSAAARITRSSGSSRRTRTCTRRSDTRADDGTQPKESLYGSDSGFSRGSDSEYAMSASMSSSER